MSNFTKGEWEVSQYNPSEIWVGANTYVATCHKLTGNGEANAQRICQCVNSFDDLREALRCIRDECLDALESADLPKPEKYSLCFAIANVAIIKADNA